MLLDPLLRLLLIHFIQLGPHGPAQVFKALE
jgi:hypothetical protein